MRADILRLSRLRQAAWAVSKAWPTTFGLALLFAAGLTLCVAAYVAKEASSVAAIVRQFDHRLNSISAAPAASQLPDVALPEPSLQLEDVATLLRTLERHKVKPSEILYGTEQPATGVTMKVVDLKLNEEYSTLKETISDLLRKLPNCYLDTIQIDQESHESARVRSALRFRLAYKEKTADLTASMAPGASR